jgi:inosine-uridine nucleoside N-ribohydrolase
MLGKYLLFVFCLLIPAFQSCAIAVEKQTKPLPVIFETDMGNDIDDALALDMLYKYMDQGKVNIVVTPFEIGRQVKYPAESIIHDFSWTDCHPMTDAYKAYRKMPYDNYTWDLISVLYAVDPADKYFTVSEKGKISVDDVGLTTFAAVCEGKHVYLTATTGQAEKIKVDLIGLITLKPAVYQGR